MGPQILLQDLDLGFLRGDFRIIWVPFFAKGDLGRAGVAVFQNQQNQLKLDHCCKANTIKVKSEKPSRTQDHNRINSPSSLVFLFFHTYVKK